MLLRSIFLILLTFSVNSNFALADSLAQSLSNFRVVDHLERPLEGANVLIGYGVDNPFPGNNLITNEFGRVESPVNWKSQLPVSILAENFISRSYVNIGPLFVGDLEVTPQKGNLNLGYNGETTEFGRLRRDGMVDFAIVTKAFKREDIIHFDITSILSDEIDTIKVAGQDFQVPSNLTLPKQKETYIIPITFNKPNFRLKVRQTGQQRFISTHGRFPLKKVVKDLQDGKAILDLVNHFEFVGGGYVDVNVTSDIDNQEIPVNLYNFDQKILVKAPKLPDASVMLSVALQKKDNYLFPSDIKKLESEGTAQLSLSSTSQQNFVLSALTPQPTEDEVGDAQPAYGVRVQQISLVIEPAGSTNPEFLPIVPRPQVTSDEILVTPPQVPANVTPRGTLFVLSEIETITAGKIESDRLTHLWEVFSDGWVDQVQLPKLKLNLDPSKKYRWEVIFMGESNTNGGGPNGVKNIENITHITRSSVVL